MKKSDLKPGMVVEVSMGRRYLVLKDRFISRDGFNEFSAYDDDLTCYSNESFNIDKVFKIDQDALHCVNEIFSKDNLILLWQREEPGIELTLEDIAKKFNVDVTLIRIKK